MNIFSIYCFSSKEKTLLFKWRLSNESLPNSDAKTGVWEHSNSRLETLRRLSGLDIAVPYDDGVDVSLSFLARECKESWFYIKLSLFWRLTELSKEYLSFKMYLWIVCLKFLFSKAFWAYFSFSYFEIFSIWSIFLIFVYYKDNW